MRAWIISAILGTAVIAHAAKPKPAPNDVLARVRASHHIFVSNVGENSLMSNGGGFVHLLYGALYQELAAWPGVQLVGTPAQADLIFAVRDSSYLDTDSVYIPTKPHPENPTRDLPMGPLQVPTAYVDVIDPETGKTLWTSSVNFGDMFDKKGIAAKVVNDALAALEPNGRGPKPSKAPALLPTQLKGAHNLFFQLSPSTAQTAETQQLQVALKQALASTCSCQWVTSSIASDLIVRVSVKLDPGNPYYPLYAMRLDIL